jgi:putative membrane protein
MTHAIDGLRNAISIGGSINSQLALFLTLFLVTNLIMLLIFSLRRRSILVKPSDFDNPQDHVAEASKSGAAADTAMVPAIPTTSAVPA